MNRDRSKLQFVEFWIFILFFFIWRIYIYLNMKWQQQCKETYIYVFNPNIVSRILFWITDCVDSSDENNSENKIRRWWNELLFLIPIPLIFPLLFYSYFIALILI